MSYLSDFEPPRPAPPPKEKAGAGLWLGLSIAATMLCCTPFGIVGIVYSALAISAEGRRDLAEAEAKVAQAKSYTLWAVGLGILFYGCMIAANINDLNRYN